jgi:predicted NBD/HSP70 family sugar kinase
VVTDLARRLSGFARRWPTRVPLWLGLVAGGTLLDRRTGGPDTDPAATLAAAARRVTGCDVAVVPQVEAMAGAELMLSREQITGRTLYVYAREAVGAVLAGPDGAVQRGATGTIAHLPVGGDARCDCGAVGCLEASAGDAAVAHAAHRAGVVDEPLIGAVVAAAEHGDREAHRLLLRRAALLGKGVALARDVFAPDRVVLMGQAFTCYRPALAEVATAFSAASVLEPLGLRVSSLGSGVQALAACTSALRSVYADPLAAAPTPA